MKLKDAYKLLQGSDDKFNGIHQDMLDILFPGEHSAYHMLSECGEECCLDELWSCVGQDYEMGEKFDLLVKYYENYNTPEHDDMLTKLIEGLKE